MEEHEHHELALLRVGTTLQGGKYRLDALIGVGGMASVYRGAHRNGNRVAVKVLHPELARSREICARFAKEGYAANTVEHPAVVRALDDDTSDGAVFLVMDLLEGESLAARMAANGPLPLEEVVRISDALLDALEAAHAKGIVHRDIKPENLFITTRGELKVLDFGIARMRDDARTAITQYGHTIGTPAYMPPEQALGLGDQIDARTDLWAVGATFFSLLSGKPVHEAASPQQQVVIAATKPARSLASVVDGVPAAVVEVVDRALRFERADRFPSAQAMREALAEAARPSTKSDDSALATADTAERPRLQLATTASGAAHAQASTLPLAETFAPVAQKTLAMPRAARPLKEGAQAPIAPTSSTRRWPLIAVGLVVGVGALTLALGGRRSESAAETETPSSAPVATMSPPAVATASALTADDPSASAQAAEDGGAVTNGQPARQATTPIASTSAARTSIRPAAVQPARSATPKASASAPSSECDPPWYVDPETNQRKVKPGCG